MSAPEVWRVVDGLGGVREVPVRVEGQLLLVGPGPQPRYYGSEEPPRLALMHYALTMRWPLARILAPGEALDDADAQRTRAEAAEAELARLRPIADAARAHVAELAALVAAEAAHTGPQPTPAGRHGAMAALLIRRRGVVGTVAALAGAVEP